jgi:hypothetical protein
VKIGVDARQLSRPLTGMGRYTFEICQALSKIDGVFCSLQSCPALFLFPGIENSTNPDGKLGFWSLASGQVIESSILITQVGQSVLRKPGSELMLSETIHDIINLFSQPDCLSTNIRTYIYIDINIYIYIDDIK